MTTDPITLLRRRMITGAIALVALSPMIDRLHQAPEVYQRTMIGLQALSEHYQNLPQSPIANPMLDQLQGALIMFMPPIHLAAPNLPVQVADHAATAFACAATGSPLLLIADMAIKNTQPRFWAFDMRDPKHPRLITASLVAHGLGSDPSRTGYATTFSNRENSESTSLGLYRVAEAYQSPKHGRAYRLEGETRGWNDLAYARDVNLHASTYVDPGHVGYSQGCLATPPQLIPTLERVARSLTGAVVWVDGPEAVPVPHCSWSQPAWSPSLTPSAWGLPSKACTA